MVDDESRVLVSRRHEHAHQGGLWEFPGGKLEAGETVLQALGRELAEELGLLVQEARPFTRIRHDYADKAVLLDVWKVDRFSGEARGLEGQPVAWRQLTELRAEEFPAANLPIIRRLNLPFWMAITPQLESLKQLHDLLDQYFSADISLIQLRQKSLTETDYLEWFMAAAERCQAAGVTLLFNHDHALCPSGTGQGLHLSARRLMASSSRPDSGRGLLGASCHNLAELRKAESLGADYATLSPVLATKHYSADQLLGWSAFQSLRQQVQMPVYALGGLSREDRQQARKAGADGIAGISLFCR
ncbi:MAG: Nudix family hydrolase [Pseudomonadales bacterium]|nr:Nudix family hydrolase [Pseudomonadales bacterium]